MTDSVSWLDLDSKNGFLKHIAFTILASITGAAGFVFGEDMIKFLSTVLIVLTIFFFTLITGWIVRRDILAEIKRVD